MKCAFIGGIVVFLWGVVSWMILPWHQMTMHKFSDEKSVAITIQDNAYTSGVYVLPNLFKHHKEMRTGMHHHKDAWKQEQDASQVMRKGHMDGESSKDHMHMEMMKQKEMMRQGPFVYAFVKKEGMEPNSAAPFIAGVIIQIIAAYIITCLLMMSKAMSYMKQVGFVTIIGLFAGIVALLPDWVWMGMSLDFLIVNMLDLVIGWFLGGLVIAKVLKK
jgi:hypothetical protein